MRHCAAVACLVAGHAEDAVAVVHQLRRVRVDGAAGCGKPGRRLLRASLVAVICGAIPCAECRGALISAVKPVALCKALPLRQQGTDREAKMF